MVVRVYEFSKKVGISNKEILKALNDNGFNVASHMAVLSQEAVDFLNSKYLKKPEEKKEIKSEPVQDMQQVQTQKKQIAQTVEKVEPKPEVKEVKKEVVSEKIQPKLAKEVLIEQPKKVEPILPKIKEQITLKPMTVAEFATEIGKPVNEVILDLLKQKIMAPINQVLSEKVINQLAHFYGIKAIQPTVVQKQEAAVSVEKTQAIKGEGYVARPPVVVVIGHVDHGKTTLLDYIRKTRVASKEKGGITQHLGAYEASTPKGNIVFLDTPGHEAFSLIRMRGIKVADIAILVVAADDGIMPQTLEAINLAKNSGIPIIVAINKIDKATTNQIEAVKRGLAQHDLTPEEWGGQTITVPISAKLGKGIDNLLDLLVLQSELMDLTANINVAAKGYILESKLEKGIGPVATVICQNGKLKVGDYFVAGNTSGRVSILIDSYGKRINETMPSIPVLVAGFTELPHIGQLFEVVNIQDYKKFKATGAAPTTQAGMRQQVKESAINIFVKTDNFSSQEALIESINKLNKKLPKELSIISSGIGAINESDVMLAKDTNSIIYSLHVRIEPNAANLAQKLEVTIKSFDIIYKLLEDLELLSESKKEIKMVSKKIGEASVLKVFDIKNIGVIAGAIVKTGKFTRDGRVIIFRGKYKVGEGKITSLQREKRAAKEVNAGFECAFMVDGFTDWQVDDRVDCYVEVPQT
ncbi:translation initiation factor IF-2 [Candidatus Dependentiae bacterium]|nr:translation initiation factor IF-2 [Candidatus Dependentiae bacterium]